MARQDIHGFVQNLCRRLSVRGGIGASDAELLDRWVVNQDEAAFELLLRRHGPLVLGVCRRLLHHPQDVEDAFQAVFLLLIRKAASIRQRQSLGSWLYKVAYRVALRARADRQKTAVAPAADLEALAAAPDDELLWRDLRPVLDDEVQRLPEKYRAAFVLCHLQGLTNQQAADTLGCPLGTVLSRLSWARQRLRLRLARRGLAVSAVGLATVLSDSAASATVVPALIQSTLVASEHFAVGTAATAGAAPSVLLAEGVLKTMFTNKLILPTVAVLGLLALGAVATFHLAQAAPPPRATPAAPTPARAKTPAKTKEVIRSITSSLNGRILVLGTEIDPKTLPAKQKEQLLQSGNLRTVKVAFLATEASKEDQAKRVPVFTVKGDKRLWRRWTEDDNPEPGRLRIIHQESTFLLLREGSRVREGQLVGLIDASLMVAELGIKIAKLNASDAERRVSKKTKEEYRKQYDRLINSARHGSVPAAQLMTARLGWERFIEEEKAKLQSVNVAREVLKQAQVMLRFRELRTPYSGTVKDVVKCKGEAVKDGEVVLHLRVAGR